MPLLSLRRARHRWPEGRPLALLAASALCLALPACAAIDWDAWSRDLGPDTPQVRVAQGWLTGQVGPMREIDSSSEASFSRAGDTTDVHLTVSTASGAAMAVLTLQGSLEFPDLAPGQQITVYDSQDAAPSDTRASVLGCAGPQVGQWEYDAPASRLVVAVERAAGEQPVYTWQFLAELPYASSPSGREELTVVSGSFQLEVLGE